MHINDIISQHIAPRLAQECERLGIPQDFVVDVNAIYPKAFSYSSLCEPVVNDVGKVIGVRIRIDATYERPWNALLAFWHEMYHARGYWENCRTSELRANLYSWKRGFQELGQRLFRYK